MVTHADDRRKHERIELRGMIVDIPDTLGHYSGFIEDISAGGFRANQIPRKFRILPKLYQSYVSGYKRSFKLRIFPCWYKKHNESGYEIGFRIIQAPWDWTHFIDEMLSNDPDTGPATFFS